MEEKDPITNTHIQLQGIGINLIDHIEFSINGLVVDSTNSTYFRLWGLIQKNQDQKI